MTERREAGIPRSSERGPSGPAAQPPRAESVSERPAALYFTADAEANRLLADDPFALMLGMLLDQQVTMEWAFGAPLLLKQRLGADQLDAPAIAAMDPAALEAVFRDKPALHRYPGSMAKRTYDLARHLVAHYDGDAANVWADVGRADDLLQRVQALPGFGKDKSRIFVGLLGKRLGVRPPGWELIAADWPSIADVDSFERVAEIRAKKRAAKAAKKAGETPKAKRPVKAPS